MSMIPESLVVRVRDPATGETQKWSFVAKSAKAAAKEDAPEKAEKTAKAERPEKTAKGQGKPAATKKKRPKVPRRDLRDPQAKEAFAAEVRELVERGASRPKEIAEKLGVDPIQVVGVLQELVEAGELTQEGRGRRARYVVRVEGEELPDPGPLPEPEVLPAGTPAKVRLRWVKEEVRGRETHAAAHEGGAFRIVRLSTGSDALFYEKADGSVYEYGCGERRGLKALAREIAVAGMPTPAAFQAAGGDLSQCPGPKRMRLDDVELTWRESVEGGRQVCVAATGDGEFKLLQSHGGSFMLVFVREGDADLERLGCGSREELEGRALDVLGQAGVEGDAAEAVTSAPLVGAGPASAAASAMPADAQGMEKELMDSLIGSAMQLADMEDD